MAGVRQFDAEAVLAKAEDVFRLRGYEATSMLDIASATGVQRGSLYNTFGDKEALFLMAFARFGARFLDTVRGCLTGEDPAAALTRLFDTAIAGMTAGTPPRGCLSTKTATQGDVPGPRIRGEVRGFLEQLEEIVRSYLAQPACAARLALPSDEAARLIVTMTRGLAVMECVHADGAVLRATARSLVTLIAPPRP